MKIKEYKYVHGKNIHVLEDRVNDLIKIGWVVQGGICRDQIQGYLISMIKYEEESAEVKCIIKDEDLKRIIKEFESCKEPSQILFRPKERKIVDCFSANMFNITNVELVESKFLEKGWSTIYKKDDILKMVKYEEVESAA